MAKVSVPPQLNRQDFPDAPDWISNLLYPVQLFFTSVIAALKNNLTLQDNISCVINTFILTAGATDTDNTYQFKCALGRVPVTMNYSCVRTDGSYDVLYPQISWHYTGNNIVINGIQGLTPTVKYTVTVVVQ